MQDILSALEWRYAVKVFDAAKKVSEADLHTILESGRLAPSSSGIEPWKFIVVENPEVRTALRAASYDQSKVTDASHVIVIARRTDMRENIANELITRASEIQHVTPESLAGWRQMVEGGVNRRNDAELDAWASAQTYIALGMMMETAALLRVDACPMEGFVGSQVDTILGLSEQHLAATTMLALGYRGEDPAAERPKVRRTIDDAVSFIR